MNTLTVSYPVQYTDEDLHAILDGAHIAYWCRDVHWGLDFRHIYFCRDEGSRDGVMTRDRLIAALATWLRTHPKAVVDGRLSLDSIDGPAADSIVQLAVFGEVVFG